MPLQKPILQNMQTQLTLFPADFLVSPIQQLDKEKAKKMNAICGRTCCERYKKFPRVTLWAKMFADYLIGTGEWYSTKCVLTWKITGIKSRPLLFLHVGSAHHTEGKEFGLLLPTPNSSPREVTEEQTMKRSHAFLLSAFLTVLVIDALLAMDGRVRAGAAQPAAGVAVAELLHDARVGHVETGDHAHLQHVLQTSPKR